MKDFSSSCSQVVTSDTCTNELNPAKYASNSFCLIKVNESMMQIDRVFDLNI